MFSLGDGAKFWLYTKPTDMRKNFNMLSGIVNNDMRQNLYSGDVFVFVNASNNMMKLLRYEPGGSGLFRYANIISFLLVRHLRQRPKRSEPFQRARAASDRSSRRSYIPAAVPPSLAGTAFHPDQF